MKALNIGFAVAMAILSQLAFAGDYFDEEHFGARSNCECGSNTRTWSLRKDGSQPIQDTVEVVKWDGNGGLLGRTGIVQLGMGDNFYEVRNDFGVVIAKKVVTGEEFEAVNTSFEQVRYNGCKLVIKVDLEKQEIERLTLKDCRVRKN